MNVHNAQAKGTHCKLMVKTVPEDVLTSWSSHMLIFRNMLSLLLFFENCNLNKWETVQD